MSDLADRTTLDHCGCCEADAEVPAHENPPGQPALTYRLGTHWDFLRRMAARLPQCKYVDLEGNVRRPLTRLTTRASDDPAIALLDAWATVADVLTFYQERIANEGYLRTATERCSVLELARAIGYELRPGVAAETYLAFTIDDSEAAPESAAIPVGTQVQSVPATQGELPQTFETMADLVARPNWNALRPRQSKPQEVTLQSNRLYLEGTDLNLSSGDLLLLVETDRAGVVQRARPRRIAAVTPDFDYDRTLVTLEPSRPQKDAAGATEAVAEEIFGMGAKEALAQTQFIVESGQAAFNAKNIATAFIGRYLLESQFQAIMHAHRWKPKQVMDYLNKRKRKGGPGTIQVFVLREQVGAFGHNAPYYLSLPAEMRGTGKAFPVNWDAPGGQCPVWKNSLTNQYYGDADLYLERTIPGILEDSWVVLQLPNRNHLVCKVAGTSETSLTGFGISAKVTALDLTDKAGKALDDTPSDKPNRFRVRKTTLYVKSEPLKLTPQPIVADLAKGATVITLDRAVTGLEKGRAVILTGEQADAPGVYRSEVLFLERVAHNPLTTLRFTQGLTYSYVRDTVTINANVARATHGETVSVEVLGSGDGSRDNQRFTLKKAPLTHTSTATASGGKSTLTVRVNDLKWQEVPSLYGLDGNSRSYTVRINDDGQAEVIFGDGRSGVRLPTGQGNVVATYRSGIGSAGELDPERLTLLKTRPLGVRSVTNPVAATGGADPERREDARTNAPLQMLTLDRIVSLKDFEDFARAFSGIAKAQAVAVWNGETQLVHITVAGTGGKEVKTGSTLHNNLRDAIDAAREPLWEVRIASFHPRDFNLSAKVRIDPAYRWEDVKRKIEAKLLDAFSFDRRAFGQSVTAAEVVSVIHKVKGVVAVDLDRLYLSTGTGRKKANLTSVLFAKTARPHPSIVGEALPAQLLLINKHGITLSEMKP